jgi:Ca2+-binding RTX toxin-like protein
MDITLILVIFVLSTLFLVLAIKKQSPSFAIAAGIGFVILSIIFIGDGVDIQTGKTSTQVLNLTNLDDVITGDVSNTNTFTFTKHNDNYVKALGVVQLLIGMLVIGKAYTDNKDD